MRIRLSLHILALLIFAAPAHAAEPGSVASNTNSMETQLVQSILSVSDNNLDAALSEVETVVRENPNFKLAQLIKGDLLLARATGLKNFGNVHAAAGRLQDFRDEARVRVRRYEERTASTLIPAFLWKLDPEQRYAIVVDVSKSTLYLYENVNGEPQYVTDFYVSSGKMGSEKLSEGDQKTPLGVYLIKTSLPKSQLTDLYGSAAYPLNYPNEWDRREGRDGHGIWLHGTPSNTYSRAPRASNGCVVLANQDLDNLGRVLQVGITPVIITNQMDWTDDQSRADRDALLKEIEQWRSDWASRNTDTYLEHYATDFSTGEMNFAEWARQKRMVNAGKSWIKVGISNLSVFAYPSQPGLVVVTFEQDYASSNLSNRMKKRQYWMKRDNQWRIVYEGAA